MSGSGKSSNIKNERQAKAELRAWFAKHGFSGKVKLPRPTKGKDQKGFFFWFQLPLREGNIPYGEFTVYAKRIFGIASTNWPPSFQP